MGCDIHVFVEEYKDAKWNHIEPGEYDWSLGWEENYGLPEWYYHGRNYNLFSVLADVRNGEGFAGCDTGDRITPMADPRGLPGDVSECVKSEHAEWDCDAHSASWFTVAELLAYNWDTAIVKRGIVSLGHYKWMKESGTDRPRHWCGGISGGGISHITQEAADTMLDTVVACENDDMRDRKYLKVEWRQSIASACGTFVTKVLPALRSLGDTDRVRVVFWFDN
jgi:hypothetical protein